MENEESVPTLNDRPFYPWRIPASETTKAIIAEAVRLIQNYEAHFKTRQRKRRPDDQAIFEATVTAVMCDVMYHHILGRQGGVFVPRSNQVLGRRNRYRHEALGKAFPAILDLMTAPEMAFIEQEKGREGHFGKAKRTTVRPGWRTLDRIKTHAVTLDDFGLSDQEEVIILRRAKTDFWDEGDDLDYPDTPDTVRMRSQVTEINDWIASAEIDFDESVLTGDSQVVDIHDKRLRRIFTQGRFDSGGRFFGGFWQSLSKQHRRNGLLIDGEDAVELDYGQMNPRIIYGMAKATPRQSDLYDIPGFGDYRNGIKKIMNSMMFTTKPLSRMPKGVRKSFAEQHSIHQVTAAIEQAHPDIASKFYTGIGHEAQYAESQILQDVLLQLKDKEIVALPIHDAVMIPLSTADTVTQIMLSTFLHHTGIEGSVSMEEGVGDIHSMNHLGSPLRDS